MSNVVVEVFLNGYMQGKAATHTFVLMNDRYVSYSSGDTRLGACQFKDMKFNEFIAMLEKIRDGEATDI